MKEKKETFKDATLRAQYIESTKEPSGFVITCPCCLQEYDTETEKEECERVERWLGKHQTKAEWTKNEVGDYVCGEYTIRKCISTGAGHSYALMRPGTTTQFVLIKECRTLKEAKALEAKHMNRPEAF